MNLIKLKHEADSLGAKINSLGIKIYSIGLQIQQLRVDLHSFNPEMKREAFVSNQVDQNHEDNKVNFDLPHMFDDYIEEEKEEEKEAVHKAYEEETHEDEGQEADFDLPPKFDEYELDKSEVLVMGSTLMEIPPSLLFWKNQIN